MGLSRDLMIRGLADKLQQRAHGGPGRALQRRLQTLAGEFDPTQPRAHARLAPRSVPPD
jgi:hypothetical protein